MNEALEEGMTATVQIDVNGTILVTTLLKKHFLPFPVPVKSVIIQNLETGEEGKEMKIRCTAEGGPPLPTISWSVPDSLAAQTTEESSNEVDCLDL